MLYKKPAMKQQLLTYAQTIHYVIEHHPYLGEQMTEHVHHLLDDLIRAGHHLHDVPTQEWRQLPAKPVSNKHAH